jgi:hypothetical protein
VLLGEGLGRLQAAGPEQLGLNLEHLRVAARERLLALQREQDPSALPLPLLLPPGSDA